MNERKVYMDNNFNDFNSGQGGQGNTPNYQPYTPSNQGGYQTSYQPYQPGGVQNGSDPFQAEVIMQVDQREKKRIKKCYSGTFIMSLIHGMGSFALAQIIFISMLLSGYEFRYTEDGTAIIDWIYNIAGSLPSMIFCLGIFLYDKHKAKAPGSAYFNTDKINGKMILGFFGMIMLAYSASAIVQNTVISGFFEIGISPISEDYLTEQDLNPTYLIWEVILTAIGAPVCEELMFRGVILRRLSTVSQRFAIVMSAVIFGLMHGNLIQAILGFIVGLVLGYAAVKTDSLILPIAGHIFINTCATSTSFAEYFFGENVSTVYWGILIVSFILIGSVTAVILFATGKIRLPEYTEYHSKRTMPIVITCVSFWLMSAYYIYEVISRFGPVTDKLLGE